MKRGIGHAVSALALAVALAAPPLGAQGNFYRWEDDRGNPVISDRPPTDPDISYQVVERNASLWRQPRPAIDSGQGRGSSTTVPDGGAPAKDGEGTSASGEALPSPELCARARANLETLDSAARVRTRGDDGELRFLTDEEREAQRAETRRAIEAHCRD